MIFARTLLILLLSVAICNTFYIDERKWAKAMEELDRQEKARVAAKAAAEKAAAARALAAAREAAARAEAEGEESSRN